MTISYTDPNAAAPTISGTATPSTTVGAAYDYTYTVTGTPAPTTSVTDGALPPGLTLSPSGEISGSPTAAGSYTFTVTASNGVQSEPDATTTNTIQVNQAPTISGTATSPATVGAPYDYTYTLTGTPAPTTSVTGGSLPPGLTLSPAGKISGSPTATGSYTFTVTASNGVQPDATTTNTIQVNPFTAPPTISGTATSPATVGATYGFTYTVTGKPDPTTSVTSGSLPPGLTLSPAGNISGSPTAVGSYTFTVTASNGVQPSASTTNTIQVNQAPTISGTATSPATVGATYDYTYTLTGTPAPTTSVASGNLPPGLTLSPAGKISGSPTAAGSYTFTVTASNGVQPSASTTNTIQVNQAPTISGTPREGGVDEPYSFTFTTSGTPTPTVSKTAGSLPPGLTLVPSGKLSGTPTAAGTYQFTVTAANGVQPGASTSVTLTIRPVPSLAVGDANTSEGNSGTKPLTFPITLSRTSTIPLTVQWTTGDGSAKAPKDYKAASGTLTIPAGSSIGYVTVQIVGDKAKEPTEVFYLLLHNATHASIGDPNASGGILNDD